MLNGLQIIQSNRGHSVHTKRDSTMLKNQPQSWAAYARLQKKLQNTTDIEHAASLERALCLILEPDYSVVTTSEADFIRTAASAGRQERHRAQLRRIHAEHIPVGLQNEGQVEPGEAQSAISLEQEVHARRELRRLAATIGSEDWTLLLGVAIGMTYDELSDKHGAPAGTLRTRVARLRRALGEAAYI
jgi:hypothetical protein